MVPSLSLDHDDAVACDVARTRLQECEALLVVRNVHQVAHQEHAGEPTADVELLDVRANRLRPAHVREYLGRLVDGRHPMSETDQLVRDAPGTAAELEDRLPWH